MASSLLLTYFCFIPQTLMNVKMNSTEAVSMTVWIFQAIIAALVLMASSWLMMVIIVLVRKTVGNVGAPSLISWCSALLLPLMKTYSLKQKGDQRFVFPGPLEITLSDRKPVKVFQFLWDHSWYKFSISLKRQTSLLLLISSIDLSPLRPLVLIWKTLTISLML